MSTHQSVKILIMCLFVSLFLFPEKIIAQQKNGKIYTTYGVHMQASPIRGVPSIVQTMDYNGEGPAPYSVEAVELLDNWEKYGVKGEYATTPVCLQQLLDDFPETVEKIKEMKLPVSLYQGIGHVLPPPVGWIRDIPGVREMSLEDLIRAEWDWQTKTLIPNWHFDEDGNVVRGNSHVGEPMTWEDLPKYRIPQKRYWIYGGILAIQNILGVTPLDFFEGRFENLPRDEVVSCIPITAVKRALGMGSFPVSYYDDNPVQCDAPWNVQQRFELLPRNVSVYGGRVGYGDLENLQKRSDFQVVWPDPEENQWKKENDALEFYKRTYGVSSFREVYEMECPVDKIMAMIPKEKKEWYHNRKIEKPEPARGEFYWDSQGRLRPGSWKERMVGNEEFQMLPEYVQPVFGSDKNYRSLPEYIEPERTEISKKDVLSASAYLLDRWPGGHHGGIIGAPPDYVPAGSRPYSLAQCFQAFALFLHDYKENGRFPDKVNVKDILGPVNYPMLELNDEPMFDLEQHRGGWWPRSINRENIPSREFIEKQGIFTSDFAARVTINEQNFMSAVQKAIEFMNNEGYVPGMIPANAQQQARRGQRSEGASRPVTLNPAELLYGMAEAIRVIEVRGKLEPVILTALKIIQDQKTEYLVPHSPDWDPHYWFREPGFVWREKVPIWRINAAWTYVPE